jgi:hypothetical protein
MLIVCNGAFKSGSTWLFTLIQFMIPHQRIPVEFNTDDRWRGHNISPEMLPVFLKEVDYISDNYICKSHYFDPKVRDLLLSHHDVYILNIKRDIRDVIVSAYYHYNREDGVKRSFDEFYWGKGRTLIGFLNKYHELWHNISKKIYVCSYKGLLEDFEKEVMGISNFLNWDLKKGDLETLREKTKLQSMRKLRKEESKPQEVLFFRKGIIGDWKNYFTPGIEKDFNRLNRKNICQKLLSILRPSQD